MPKIRCENPFRYFRNVSSLTTGWGKFCCESEKPKKVARSWPWLSSCSRLNESERGLFLLRGTRADRSRPTLSDRSDGRVTTQTVRKQSLAHLVGASSRTSR